MYYAPGTILGTGDTAVNWLLKGQINNMLMTLEVVSPSRNPSFNSGLTYITIYLTSPIGQPVEPHDCSFSISVKSFFFQLLKSKYVESSLTPFLLSYPNLPISKSCLLHHQIYPKSDHFSPSSLVTLVQTTITSCLKNCSSLPATLPVFILDPLSRL